MISLLLFSLAAICNAIMDTSVHHYHISILSKFKNTNYWDGHISWKNKYNDTELIHGRIKWLNGIINKPLIFCDAWHLFKSLMIIFLVLSVLTFNSNYEWWIMLIIYGVNWNITFNIFYNNLLIKQ